MNIHEYQGKALLKSLGAPVADGVAVFKAERGGSRGEEAARTALCGEEPDPCRRPRQGQVQGARPRRQGRRQAGEVGGRCRRQRQGDARQDAGHQADRPGGQAGQPPLHRGRRRHRPRALSVDPGRPLGRPHRLRRLDRRRHGHRGGGARHAGKDRHRRDRSGKGRHGDGREGAQCGAEARRRRRPRTAKSCSRCSTTPSSART